MAGGPGRIQRTLPGFTENESASFAELATSMRRLEELRGKGAQFRGPIEEREYGRVIMMIVPGANDMQLYQPIHKLAYNL